NVSAAPRPDLLSPPQGGRRGPSMRAWPVGDGPAPRRRRLARCCDYGHIRRGPPRHPISRFCMLNAGLLTTALAALAAFAVTAIVRRNAGALGLVAEPNARSSHTVPTPSGGGVGIVAGGVLGGILVVSGEPWPAAVLLAAALLIAAIGFLDDRRPLPAVARLGAQLLLVALVAAVALPADGLASALGLPLPPLLVTGLAVLAAVYWINLFNFMDGIDGLAASQAIFMLLAAALLASGY